MSSLRLALKMSIEESKTPDVAENKTILSSTKQNKLFPERTTPGTSTATGTSNPKHSQSMKRKKNEINLDENLSEAETEDSLRLTSDQDDSNHGTSFKKVKLINDKKKKTVTPPEQQLVEKCSEYYDPVEPLIASRQTPPIGTSGAVISTPTPSKKASKERPKTPVMSKSSKHEKSILPILPAEGQVKEETDVTDPLSAPQVDATSKVNLVIPEPVKVEPIEVVEAPKDDNVAVVEPKVEVESPAVEEPPKEPSVEEKVKIEVKESTPAPEPQSDEMKESSVSHDGEDPAEKSAPPKKAASNKKKRKGGPDLTESEEPLGASQTLIEPEKSEELDGEKGGETVRAPSRAAAVAAKSKINHNSTKGKIAPDAEQKKTEENPAQVAPIIHEVPPQSSILKAQWVACDKCSKWRRIPGDIDLSTLPEEWYCTMNIWDTLHNDCSHVEEEYVEKDDDEPPQQVPLPTQIEPPTKKSKSSKGTSKAGGKRGRKPVTKEATDIPAPTAAAVATHDSDDEGEGYMGTRRRRGRVGSVPNSDPLEPAELNSQLGYALPPNATFEKVHWVQCGKCSKWRKVPGRIHEEGLPDVWYCAMNTWAVEYSRCSAKEEEDDTISLPANLAERAFDNRGGVGRGRYVRKTRPPDPGSVPQSIRPWVQCERKNCKKWRKLPAHVDVSTLPEKWYCEMNSWDPERATCDASEETDSESEHPTNAATRSQLILGNSKGPGTLSYRRLIFGTDGRIRPFYSERNKNGYGLFSYTEVFRPNDDEYVMPTRKISYWWSSSYQDSGTSFTTSTKSKKIEIPKSKEELNSVGNRSYESSLHPSQTHHLVDCILRLSPPSSVANAVVETAPPATKWSKIANKGRKLSLLSRMNFSCEIIRLALVSCPVGLTLDEIFEKIMSMYFLNPPMESCRNSLGLHEIKETLYRLEQNGEIEVIYNNDGILLFRFIFQLLKQDDQQPSVNPYPEIHSDLSLIEGKSRPLKMRKRKFKGFEKDPPAACASSSSSSSVSMKSSSMEVVNEKEESINITEMNVVSLSASTDSRDPTDTQNESEM